MNLAETLAALKSGSEVFARDIPDTDEGNALLLALSEHPNVRTASRKRNGAHVVAYIWGR